MKLKNIFKNCTLLLKGRKWTWFPGSLDFGHLTFADKPGYVSHYYRNKVLLLQMEKNPKYNTNTNLVENRKKIQILPTNFNIFTLGL